MSSQLNVDTIVDKAGSGGSNVKMANTSTYVSDGGGATQNTVQGIAKAWMHIDTSTVQDSFNNSSITDNSVGNNTNTLANNMSNANYAVPSSTNAVHYSNVESYATSSYRHRTTNTSASAADRSDNVNAVFGDLA
jgi:hypothetical protein|tara:strand:+ start:940 stop:1344 length:405 start_codon:yes stop_codon:yes gene_type:complete